MLTALPVAADLHPAILPLHERWFVDSTPAGDWGHYLAPLPLMLTAAVLTVTVAWRLLALRVHRPELPRDLSAPLSRLVPWVPRLLGIHLGVSLLVLAADRAFLTPSVSASGYAGLLLLEAALGVWLITGWRLRIPAAMVLALGPLLAILAGATTLGECANLAAVAAFLLIVPPGADRHGATTLGTTDDGSGDPGDSASLRWALLAMRLGVGAALITLAFSEKFTNPDMALATLDAYPQLNVFAVVGIPMPDATFVLVAGAVELLFGLLVISGAFPQVAVLVAAVPFNATLVLFGQTELVGHLPVYGVFLALLVYGSHPDTYDAVRWLPAPRRAATTAAGPRQPLPAEPAELAPSR
jgi:uncharacterized membrane protein YphA (DoxX/SURF4 family)